MNRAPDLPPHLDDLVDRWRSAACVGGWRAIGDWHCASVADVAAAAIGGGEDGAAALRLGRARAVAGVGIDEGLDDLDRLWIVLGDVGAPNRTTRAFAQGWADAAAAPSARPARDEASGLATVDVLRIRVEDLRRTGAADASALVIVTSVDPGLPRFARHLEVAAIGTIIGEALPGAESPVRLAADRVVAIAPRDGALDEGVIRLRRAVDRRSKRRGEPDDPADTVRIAALPATGEPVDAWLHSLER